MTAASPTLAGAPRYLFIVTYGRSGSTLTQGMLNAMPRVLIRGENNLFPLPLFRAHAGLARFKRKFGGPGAAQPASAFYGLREVDLDAFAMSVRELVRRQLLGEVPAADVDLLGFKEVLWHRVKPNEWHAFFDFFDVVFGSPQYVLNRRDVEMTAASGFWRKLDPDEAKERINRTRELQDYLRESRPERSFLVEFEAMTSDDQDVAADQLRRLAQFATGGCDDALLATLFETRGTGHGPHPFGRARGEAGDLAGTWEGPSEGPGSDLGES